MENRYKENSGIQLPDCFNTLTKLQAKVLSSRIDIGKIEEFSYNYTDVLNSKFDPIKNLHKLPDVMEAGKFIAKAIKDGKNILHACDFDADGVNSAAVAHVAFRDIFNVPKDKFVTMVNRRRTGTGFSKHFINNIIELNKEWPIDVMIIYDHGSSDNEAYGVLKSHGIKHIVLTDHHKIPEDNYPINADFVVNPHRVDSEYYKDVSGCFVGYVTMLSTLMHLNDTYTVSDLDKLLPYVAFSTVSDVMSLSHPINRQVIKLGLREMNKLTNPVWLVMKRLLQIHNTINTNDIGYKLAPLINAANRVDREGLAFSILVSENYDDCMLYAKKLFDLNILKKTTQKAALKDVIKQVQESEYTNSIVTVINTEYAINGIISGNIGERYYKPSVCFLDNKDSDILAGSGRGIISGINLEEIYGKIAKESDIVIKYGGHELAAGITIKKDGLEQFKMLFDKHVSEVTGIETERNVKYDIKLNSDDISPYVVSELNRLAPYGKDWKKPVYFSKLKIYSILVFGTMAKVKFVTSSNKILESMHYFNTHGDITVNNIKDILTTGSYAEVVYNLDISTFNDVVNLDMTIIDINRSE